MTEEIKVTKTDKRIRPAAKGLIMHKGKFLILKTEVNNKVMWDLPGGKIEYGENPYETLHREVMEETCLRVELKKIMGMYWFFRVKDKVQVICSLFLCETDNINNIDITQDEDEDITGYEWVTPEEYLTGKYYSNDFNLIELIKRDIDEIKKL